MSGIVNLHVHLLYSKFWVADLRRTVCASRRAAVRRFSLEGLTTAGVVDPFGKPLSHDVSRIVCAHPQLFENTVLYCRVVIPQTRVQDNVWA